MTTKYMTVYITKPIYNSDRHKKSYEPLKSLNALLLSAFIITAYILTIITLFTSVESSEVETSEPAISTINPVAIMQEETNIALLEDLVPTLPPVEEVVEELIEVESDEVVIEEEVIPEAEQIDLYDDITFLGYYNVTGYDPYCEHCCGKSDGITASGEVAQYNHTVAMNDLPFGTKIYIPYLGVYYVEDRGSSSVGVDIASIDHEACYAITASNQPVYIINS